MTSPTSDRTIQTDHRFYGRRKGHALRDTARRLVDTLLPRLRLTVPAHGQASLPGGPWWLEIGFGRGEHLAVLARAHPTVRFLGAEPFINGVAGLLQEIEAHHIENIRIFDDDVRALLPALPDASVERVFLLFPDPWPKARHHKRRFVCRDNLDQLARVLTPGGELRFVTDHADYAAWGLREILGHGGFQWTAERAADWRQPPADWVETRYQAKARAEGRAATFLLFRRRP